MSDGMAFLTGAACAGVAVLLLFKGGDNLSLNNNIPPSRPLTISPNNPYNTYDPYATTSPTVTPTSPDPTASEAQQQQLTGELRPIVEQQRLEIEQLKTQLQNQQLLIENLTTQLATNPLPPVAEPVPAIAPEQEETENSLLSGVVWALGGMAVTISGGVVVVGALALLTRQQRSPRTTYVVPHPYTALPPTGPRRRSEFVPTQVESRHYDQLDYE